MENLNEVVARKIEAKLAKGMTNAQNAMARLMSEGKVSRDFIFEVGTSNRGQSSRINFYPDSTPTGRNLTRAEFYINGGIENFTVNPNAIRQVADKLSIPQAYLLSLLGGKEWQQTLAYNILNTHNGWTDRSRVLVRAVGNEVRGFLSDAYRRLDSQMIFDSHIEEIFRNGAVLSDGFMDETRVMVESLLPTPIEVRTELNGVIMLAFGTRLSTSDYGDGALELRSFVMQGVCLNGMVRESVLKERHLGGRLPENLSLSERTYRLDSETQSSAVKDLTKNLFDTDIIKNRMLEIKAASEIVVDPAKELKMLTGKLLKGEQDEIGKILMRNNPEDGVQGESTLWKLTQGITSYANRETVTDRRRMELQELAGGIFNQIKQK